MTLSGKIRTGIILLVMLNAFVETKIQFVPFDDSFFFFSIFAPVILFMVSVLLFRSSWKIMLQPDWNYPMRFFYRDNAYFLSRTFFFASMLLAASAALFINSIIFQSEIWKSAINFALSGSGFMACTLIMSKYLKRIRNQKIVKPTHSHSKLISTESPFDLDKLIADDCPEKEITDDDFENLK